MSEGPEALEWSRPLGRALAEGQGIHRVVPGLAELHIDRPLPFLCVYRRPVDRDDPGTERLVSAEASYLKASGDAALASELAAFVADVVEALTPQFDGFMLLEIWSGPPVRDAGDAVVCIVEERGRAPRSTIHHLQEAMGSLTIGGRRVAVERRRVAAPAPPGLAPVLDAATMRSLGCAIVGLELPALFRGDAGIYPLVLRDLHRSFTHALRRGLAEFLRVHTSQPVGHFLSLGPRFLTDTVAEIDRSLARIDRSFDFLLQVTPVNARAARARFFEHGADRAPALLYRPCPVEPDLVKRALFELPIERIDDPVMEELFLEKRDEISRKLSLLRDVGTRRFLYGSLALWGEVDDALLHAARDLLREPAPRYEATRAVVGAHHIARRARAQIAAYLADVPDVRCRVDVRDDVVGLTVSKGNLLIADDAELPASRVEAILAHEVGTHVVTYVNGRQQPFRLLALGLVGYDELQEGLAVLAEHLAGGLTLSRLRLLAGRVVGARAAAEGASFVDVYRVLSASHGFGRGEAFGITLRLFRGGGLVKDAIYLRGLLFLLEYLRRGGDLEPLYVGKVAPAHLPLLHELRLRGMLVPPRILPLHLEGEEAKRKIARLRQGLTPRDLVASEE